MCLLIQESFFLSKIDFRQWFRLEIVDIGCSVFISFSCWFLLDFSCTSSCKKVNTHTRGLHSVMPYNKDIVKEIHLFIFLTEFSVYFSFTVAIYYFPFIWIQSFREELGNFALLVGLF